MKESFTLSVSPLTTPIKAVETLKKQLQNNLRESQKRTLDVLVRHQEKEEEGMTKASTAWGSLDIPLP